MRSPLRPVLVLGLLAAACAAVDREAGPAAGDLTWSQFLRGDDIRAACAPGEPDHFRLIRNADFRTPLQAYEVREGPGEGAAAVVEVRAFAIHDVAMLDRSRPAAAGRVPVARAPLSESQFRELVRALGEFGAFAPPAAIPEDRAESFRWLMAGCHEGRYFLGAHRREPGTFARALAPPVRGAGPER